MRPHVVGLVAEDCLRASLDMLLIRPRGDRWQVLAPLLAGSLRFQCGC